MTDASDPRGLKARLKQAKLSQSDLAEFLGVDYHVAHRIVSGLRKRLSAEEERAIERFFEQAGGGAPLRPSGQGAQIPLYGFAAASPFGPIHLDHDQAGETVARHPAQGRGADAFAVRVWGESMAPRYEPGEIAYCVRGQHPRRGQDVIIELKSGDAYLKTYEGQRDGVVRLKQLNPPPGEGEHAAVALKEIAALHAVVGRG